MQQTQLIADDHNHATKLCTQWSSSCRHLTVKHHVLKRNKKLSSSCNSRSYCTQRTVYWQTIKKSLRTAGMHNSIQWVELMNASKLYLLKC